MKLCDVEAFVAALNSDIEGDSSTFQPSDSDAPFAQGSNHTSSRFPQWQTSNLEESASCQSQQGMNVSQLQEIKQHGSGSENQQQRLDTLQEAKQKSIHIPQSRSMHDSENNPNPPRVQEPERTEQHLDPRLQKMSSSSHQQAIAAGQAINIMNRNKRVPFALLVPVIEPQLDKDKAMQFQTVYNKLKQNEISKDVFVRHMRSIVGDQVLKMAVYNLQGQAARISQSGPNHFPSQHMQMPPISSQLHTKGPAVSSSDQSQIPSLAAQVLTDPSNLTMANNTPTSREVGHQSDSHGVQQIDQANEQQQKPQLATRQGLSSFPPVKQGNIITGNLRDESFDTPSSRTGFSAPPRSITAQLELNSSLNSRIQSTTSPVGPGSNAKPPPQKPSSIGQKKTLELLGSSPPLLSKKQKISGAFSNQSIEQLNDVEKLQKINESEGNTGVDGDKDKDDGRGKSVKANKEEDDKMLTTAANVAAWAAVGGGDRLVKWQLMAEQARQKREGGPDVASVTQPAKEVGRKPVSTTVKNSKDNNLEAENRSLSTAVAPSGVRKSGKSQFAVPQSRVARSISVKDVIAVLEYENMRKDAVQSILLGLNNFLALDDKHVSVNRQVKEHLDGMQGERDQALKLLQRAETKAEYWKTEAKRMEKERDVAKALAKVAGKKLEEERGMYEAQLQSRREALEELKANHQAELKEANKKGYAEAISTQSINSNPSEQRFTRLATISALMPPPSPKRTH